MLRYLIGILVSILVLTFVRAVMKLLMKTAGDALRTQTEPAQPQAQRNRGPEKGTMLRKCGKCGTFAPETTMLRRRVQGEDAYFCASTCVQKS